jgi:hypothetical protein
MEQLAVRQRLIILRRAAQDLATIQDRCADRLTGPGPRWWNAIIGSQLQAVPVNIRGGLQQAYTLMRDRALSSVVSATPSRELIRHVDAAVIHELELLGMRSTMAEEIFEFSIWSAVPAGMVKVNGITPSERLAKVIDEIALLSLDYIVDQLGNMHTALRAVIMTLSARNGAYAEHAES